MFVKKNPDRKKKKKSCKVEAKDAFRNELKFQDRIISKSQKAPSQTPDWVLNMPLPAHTKSAIINKYHPDFVLLFFLLTLNIFYFFLVFLLLALNK